MTVMTDFRLALDQAPEAVAPGALERPGMRRRLEAALAEFETAARPAACHETYAIEATLHERLRLAGGMRVGCGALTAIVAGAEHLHIAACTLGARLDERIRALRAEGRSLEMLLLDELGSWAADQMRTQLYEHLCRTLADRDIRASSPLSPGESEWPLREQRALLQLADASRLGITLGVGDLMRPLKSLTFVFGSGTGDLGAEGLSGCHFCTIVDRCRYAAARMAGEDRAKRAFGSAPRQPSPR